MVGRGNNNSHQFFYWPVPPEISISFIETVCSKLNLLNVQAALKSDFIHITHTGHNVPMDYQSTSCKSRISPFQLIITAILTFSIYDLFFLIKQG